MEINYKQELLDLLENNEIKNLPSQNLIDSDIRFALAIWKNYEPNLNLSKYEYEDITEEDYYKALKWGTILNSYQENIDFWHQSFELKQNYKILLTDAFKEDFPFITKKWLNDDDKLIELFEKTKNKDFLNLVKSDEKNIIYKDYLIKNINHATKEDIEKYQEDLLFVTKLLSVRPFNYINLSEFNKHNHDYIKLALKNKDMWSEIPEKFQKESVIRTYWFNSNINKFQLKEVDDLKEEEKVQYFKYNPNGLNSALNKNYYKYKEIAIKFLEEDIQTYISAIPTEFLENDIKKELSKNNILKNNLINFIKSYKKVDKFSPKEKNLFNLAAGDNEIEEIASNNFFYVLQGKKLSNQKIEQEEFNAWIKIIIKDENLLPDDARKLILLLKSVTAIEVLKLLPKTKDLLTYYKHEDLAQQLENRTDLKIVPKIKI